MGSNRGTCMIKLVIMAWGLNHKEGSSYVHHKHSSPSRPEIGKVLSTITSDDINHFLIFGLSMFTGIPQISIIYIIVHRQERSLSTCRTTYSRANLRWKSDVFLGHAISAKGRRVRTYPIRYPHYIDDRLFSVRCKFQIGPYNRSRRSKWRSSNLLGDSGEMPDNRCSNCVQYGFDCTHKEVTKVCFLVKWWESSTQTPIPIATRPWALQKGVLLFRLQST